MFSVFNEIVRQFLKGSFSVGEETYEIEPYHPKVHKRSLGAKQGDHIIKKRETSVPSDAGYDYICKYAPEIFYFIGSNLFYL